MITQAWASAHFRTFALKLTDMVWRDEISTDNAICLLGLIYDHLHQVGWEAKNRWGAYRFFDDVPWICRMFEARGLFEEE